MFQTFRFTIGDAPVSLVLPFVAKAIAIENYTTLWIRFPRLGQFVRPSWSGVVLTTLDEMVQFDFSQPVGIPATATVAGQYATITYYDTPMTPAAGSAIIVRAPSTEWRNPKSLTFAYDSTDPPGNFTLFTYTVPPGRRARVDQGQCITEIQTAYTGSGNIDTVLQFTNVAGVSNYTITARIAIGKVIGARADIAIPSTYEMIAGEQIIGAEFDPRVGGTALHYATVKITEGDA